MYTYSKLYWPALYLYNTIVVLFFIQSTRDNPVQVRQYPLACQELKGCLAGFGIGYPVEVDTLKMFDQVFVGEVISQQETIISLWRKQTKKREHHNFCWNGGRKFPCYFPFFKERRYA